ncbi:MAG: Bax inhibitor-1/YccA family protein [Bacteroidales bacterium]|nr:Bax inhibitor-1/YccA family protein [Bacteroidales bacterium]
MALLDSRNPALGKAFKENVMSHDKSGVMTVNGTIYKTGLLALLVLAAATVTWNLTFRDGNPQVLRLYTGGGAIMGFIMALVIVFKKTSAPYLAPVYAVCEGLFLGGVSAMVQGQYEGLVLQAFMLTLAILFGMLFLYRTGMIKATEKFKRILFTAIIGIGIAYFVSFIGGMFGFHLPFLHSNSLMGNSLIGIGISLVIVVVAALSLVIDFDMIERGAQANAPKYMEWYGAFGLMVTIVWLYFEILRLLVKIAGRR